MIQNSSPDALAKMIFWLTLGGAALFISTISLFVL